MKKVTFKRLRVPSDLKRTEFIECDVRKDLGNHIFRECSDLGMLKLAEKIYDSGDEVELNEEEATRLQNIIQHSGITLAMQCAIAIALGVENWGG
jgi:hypothetical protein